MKDPRETVDEPASPSALRRIESICTRFEDAWQAGRRPPLEEYLNEADPSHQQRLLRELIALDIDYRRQLGENPELREYRERFPTVDDHWLERLAGAGRYELAGEIGSGGMGTVLQGYDRHLRRDLALKMLRPELCRQPYYIRRFLREAWIGARLQHPGIVPVYDLDEFSDRQPFFTMKLVRGRTLQALLKERADPAQELPRFLTIFEQVCQTVAYAHAQGVIHRDLKPANIMVGTFGEVQVMDWGMAKVLDGANSDGTTVAGGRGAAAVVRPMELTDSEMQTQAGQAIGTLSYMPPEQARGEVDRLDERSDVFGLGAILCEILSGEPPFGGGSAVETLAQAKACDHAAVLNRLEASATDAELVHLVRACLAAEPASRPRNADAVAQQVKAYREGTQEALQAAERQRAAAEARMQEARRTAAAERRARRGMVAAALAVVLVSLVGVATTSWQYWQANEARVEAEKETQAKQGALEEVKQALVRETQAERLANELKQRALDANKHYRSTLFAATTHLAHQAWGDGQIARCLDLLDGEGCQPSQEDHADLRGWEWHYLRSLSHREARSWPGDEQSNPQIALTSDGRHLALGGVGRVFVWDVARGTKLHTLTGHPADIRGLAYSPDDSRLVSGDWNGVIKLWDAATGQALQTWHNADRICSLIFSSDGRCLAIGGEKGPIRLLDPRDGRQLRVLTGHASNVRGLAFSADNRWLASASEDRTVRLWRVADGQLQRILKGHTDKVNSVVFRGDGRQLASSSEDLTVRLWDVDSGKEAHILSGHTAYVWDAVFDPEGRWLASAGDDRIVRLWDVASGKEVRVLRGHKDLVRRLRFSPDGRWLVSVGTQEGVKFWDLQDGPQEARNIAEHRGAVTCLAFAPDSKRLATGSRDRTLLLWDTQRGTPPLRLAGHTDEIWGLAFHPDGRQLATANYDRTVRLWDAATGKLLRTFAGHTNIVLSVAFSSDGRLLASAGRDRRVKVWDVATAKEVRSFAGHSDEIFCVAFRPDDRLLASSSNDGTVRLWDVDQGDAVHTLTGHQHGVRSLAFRRDGQQLATAGVDGTIRLWDTDQRQLLRTLRGHTGRVFTVAFGPDDHLASGGEDQTVRIWDPQSGHELLILKGHRALIYQVAFSSDGRWLASASGDQTILLRDASHRGKRADSGQPLRQAPAVGWHHPRQGTAAGR